MTQTRIIHKVTRSKPTLEGAGVHLRRAFGFGDTQLYDPFLLLDDFRGDKREDYIQGFPWHPHRGIETITYVLEGEVEHGDNMGNKGIIGAGDMQWMTAGSGIIHQEMPHGAPNGHMYGFQLWANLPRSHKMMPPRYQEVKSSQIPQVDLPGGGLMRVICGKVGEVKGPIQDVMVEPEYLDISLPPEGSLVHPTIRGHTVFAYVFAGDGIFCGENDPFAYETEGSNYFDTERCSSLGNTSLIVFEDGDQIQVNAGGTGMRFLLISGKPLHEPVAWYGPIVMNTSAELQTAFEELQNDTFIK